MIGGGVTSTTPPQEDGAPAEHPAIVIEIAKKGEIYVGSKLVADGTLAQMLRDVADRDKESKIVIHADQDVPYARVVFVLDQAKAAGLRRIAFGTGPAKK